MWDAAKLGTGVLKGPNVVKRYSKRGRPIQLAWTSRPADHHARVGGCRGAQASKPPRWTRGTSTLTPPVAMTSAAPAMCGSVTPSPRGLLPSCGACRATWGDQLRLVLQEQPVRTVARETKAGSIEAITEAITKGNLYEMWEYHGEVAAEDLEQLGCDCMDREGPVSACVVFINDRPVKAVLNVLDTDDLVYDFSSGPRSVIPFGASACRVCSFGSSAFSPPPGGSNNGQRG